MLFPTGWGRYGSFRCRCALPVALLAFFCLPACEEDTDVQDVIVSVTLLQTSDIHHHAAGNGAYGDYTPMDTSDSDPVMGGYARLAALVGSIRAEQEVADVPVLLVDSGDFTMGTIYDLNMADPIAFKMQEALGYDAVTLGNHEFDCGPAGLAGMIDSAMASTPPFAIPIVVSNLITDPVSEGDDALEAFFTEGGLVDRLMVTLDNGLKVGFVGLLGEIADEDAAGAPPVTFNHEPAHLQAVVDDLRNNQGAHLVIALAHVGMKSSLDEGEDFDLAEEVTGIDVIASGHTHLPTADLIQVGNTLIFEPGGYGEYLARLDLSYNLTRRQIESSSFELIPIDDQIEGNQAIQELVEQANEDINEMIAPLFDLEVDSPLAELDFSLPKMPLVEVGVGNLAADAFRTIATLRVQSGPDPTPFTAAVLPNGRLRSGLYADSGGIVRFADMYNVLAGGISPDPSNQQVPGWPLVSVYLTGPELLHVCEINVTGSQLLGDRVFLHLSGIRCEYDPEAIYFFRVRRIYLCGNTLPASEGGDGDLFSTTCDIEVDPEDTTSRYRVVADLYTLLMLEIVPEVMSVIPRFADDTPIDLSDPETYLASRLDVNPETAGVQELKSWGALLEFLQSLPDEGGDPQLPDIPEGIYGPSGSGMGRIVPVTTQ
ncbi:MAG: metallophosphoesterase [Bradymonadales bacterium]|nr:metallophosphoesterase [Bradymonadales bacterium]